MKRKAWIIILLLTSIILFKPQNTYAIKSVKKCIYADGTSITIKDDLSATVSVNSLNTTNWNDWKKVINDQAICPKYIIKTQKIQVTNSESKAKEYSTKKRVLYFKLSSEEDLTKSNNVNNANMNCNSLLGDTEDEESVAWLVQHILNYVKLAGPVLVLIFTSIDYLKALVQSDDETMAKNNKKLATRILLAVLLFFIPTLVNVLLGLFGFTTSGTCNLE